MVSLFSFYCAEVGARTMQRVAGLGHVMYWLSTWLWDSLTVMGPSLLVLPVLYVLDQWAFLGDGRWAVFLLVMLLFCWAIFPMVYAVQFLFGSSSFGVLTVLVASFFSGLLVQIIIHGKALRYQESEYEMVSIRNVSRAPLFGVFYSVVSPYYNVANCFVHMYINYHEEQLCAGRPCGAPYFCCSDRACTDGSPCTHYDRISDLDMEWPGISSLLLFMLLQGTAGAAVVMVIEYKLVRRFCKTYCTGHAREKMFTENHNRVTDETAEVERQRILQMTPQQLMSPDAEDQIALVNLHKRVGSTVVINCLCLGVSKGACVGLIAKDWLWKSTIMRMLIGEIMPTSGQAYIGGKDSNKVQGVIGYSPHSDCHLKKLSGLETISMFARIRGVPEKDIRPMALAIVQALSMDVTCNDLVDSYNEPMSRMLSTACALMGDPPILLLDEPFYDIDSRILQQLLEVLKAANESGSTILLTSHRMEECFALCTSIAFVANGTVTCLGSAEYLKSKFDHGYIVMVHMAEFEDGIPAPAEPLIQELKDTFQLMVLELLPGSACCQILGDTALLADILAFMEVAKSKHCLQDYGVQNMSLDLAFNTLTRSHHESTVSEDTTCTPAVAANIIECGGEDTIE